MSNRSTAKPSPATREFPESIPGLALAREDIDNECLSPASDGTISPEMLSLLEATSYGFWRWDIHTGELSVQGIHGASSVADWSERVHPGDREAFSSYLDRDWQNADETSTINYRFDVLADGNFVPVRHISATHRSDRLKYVVSFVIADSDEQDDQNTEAHHLIEITKNWVQRAGWHSFINQIRRLIDADALMLVELDSSQQLSKMVAQSVSESCNLIYSSSEIPDFLSQVPALSSIETAPSLFECPISDSFTPIDRIIGQIVSDRKAGSTAVLIAGYSGSHPASGSSTKSILSLVASLVSTQVHYDKEVASRKEIESMLRQSQKLTSVGRLATGIAHDFNNLLTVIQGHTSLLEMSVEKTGDHKSIESLELIQSASQQAVELSKQLLFFSRQQSVNLERCELNTVVSDFVKMMRRMVEETIDIEVKLGSRIGPIEADRSMLGQVMMNLIVNARDSMPDGGKITIQTSNYQIGEPQGSIEAGDYAVMKITDTGSGIPTDKLPKIFDPFFTTKEKGKGTGLGLANVAAIIREHGGQIDVSSTPGVGTTFELLLPTTTKRAAAKPVKVEATNEEESIRGATVLLVEDESAVRKLVRKLLEMHGCTVIEAPSGKQALDLWPKIAKDISVVVTDVVMPEGVSGWDLAKELHETHPDLGILLTSGYNERPEDHGLGGESQIAFLQKPYESKHLKHTLFQLINQAKIEG